MEAMYDYDPFVDSPNQSPHLELTFKKGQVITVYGDMVSPCWMKTPLASLPPSSPSLPPSPPSFFSCNGRVVNIILLFVRTKSDRKMTASTVERLKAILVWYLLTLSGKLDW